MSTLKDTFEEICQEQNLGFFSGLKSTQAFRSIKNSEWPILYLDAPKNRLPQIDAQGALTNRWSVFFTILDKDKKANSEAQTQVIIDACRTQMDEFIQRLRDKTGTTGRKVVALMEDLSENELRQWSTEVLSGVAMEMTITFMDPNFQCT